MIPTDVDITVVGGGIQGAGVAQAAAAAGYSVLLLERSDWGAGTSSRSSKLIHGGLRYLETGQWRLVRKALAERAVLLRIAPHLVRAIPFVIPLYRGSFRSPWTINLGLNLYRLLAGGAPLSGFERLGLGSEELPAALSRQGLRAAFRYWDAQTDDRALTRAVVASAAALGAVTVTGSELGGATAGEGGWHLRWQQGATPRQSRCRVLVNAGGPWVNQVMARCEPRPRCLSVEMVQGTHLLLPMRLGEAAFYLEASDRRGVFAMPWGEQTLLGTTERGFVGDPDHCRPTEEEEAYLLATLGRYFPHSCQQVSTRFAGLRVLPVAAGGFFDRPRDTALVQEWDQGRGMIALYGGKLTTYRMTAADVVAAISVRLGARVVRADTACLPLPQL